MARTKIAFRLSALGIPAGSGAYVLPTALEVLPALRSTGCFVEGVVWLLDLGVEGTRAGAGGVSSPVRVSPSEGTGPSVTAWNVDCLLLVATSDPASPTKKTEVSDVIGE